MGIGGQSHEFELILPHRGSLAQLTVKPEMRLLQESVGLAIRKSGGEGRATPFAPTVAPKILDVGNFA